MGVRTQERVARKSLSPCRLWEFSRKYPCLRPTIDVPDSKRAPMWNTDDNKSLMANPMMSRRHFFSLAAVVGALTFLGSMRTPHGLMVSAWADEENKVHFTLYILGRDELPIICYDLTDGANNKKPVEGMEITITSPYKTGVTKNATTNTDGLATVHVKELSLESEDDTASEYSFWGEVAAATPYYREFHVDEIFLCTGVTPTDEGTHVNTLEIPTHQLEYEDYNPSLFKPYLRTVTLDSCDVQYTDTDCAVGAFNDIEHTFHVEVMAPAKNTVDVSVVLVSLDGTQTQWDGGKGQGLTASSENPMSYATTFTGTWLKDAEAGSMLKVKFGIRGEETYVMSSKIQFVASKDGIDDTYGTTTIRPGHNSADPLDTCPLPKLLIKAGDTCAVGFPELPIQLFSDVYGNFGIVATLSTVTWLKRKNGQNDLQDADKVKKLWQGSTWTKSWNGWKNSMQSSWDNCVAAENNSAANHHLIGFTPLTSKLNAGFTLQAQGYMNWKPGDKAGGSYWTGDLALMGTFSLNYSVTEQFVAVVFPLFLVFDFSVMLALKMAFGLKFLKGFSEVEWGHDLGFLHVPAAFMVIFHIEVGLSLGAGIAGVANAGIRGGGYLRFEFFFDKVKDKPNPHITGKCTLNASLFLQLFLLKKTWVIYQSNPTGFLDNWSTESADDEDSGTASLSALATGHADSWANASVVSDEELSYAADYQAQMVPLVGEDLSSLSAGEDDQTDGAAKTGGYVLKYTRKDKGARSGLSALSTSDEPTLGIESPYSSSGATTYNPTRGLKPTFKKSLCTQTYSNARLRVAHGSLKFNAADDAEAPVVVGRLVSVDIDNGLGSTITRTRVAVRAWDHKTHSFGEEQVVDLPATEAPSDRYDTDFDLDVYLDGSDICVGMALTSITRPENEAELTGDELVDKYAKSQYVSYILWNMSLSSEANQQTSTNYSWRNLLDEGSYVSCPRILFHPYMKLSESDDEETLENVWAHIYFLKTDSNDRTSVSLVRFKDGNTDRYEDDLYYTRGYDLTFADFRQGSFEVYSVERCVRLQKSSADYLTNVVVGWSGRSTKNTGAYGADGRPFSIVFTALIGERGGMEGSQVNDDLELPGVASLTKRTVHDGENIPFVYSASSSETSDEKPYCLVRISTTLKISTEDAAGKTTTGQFFSSGDGKWLYTVRQVNQEIPALSEEGVQAKAAGAKLYCNAYKDDDNYGDLGDVTTEGGAMELYQLMEARWYPNLDTSKTGSYYQFYPIAQMDFCPDNIDVVSHTDGRRDFIMSTISAVSKTDSSTLYALADDYETDDVNHVADISHVAVPAVLGLHVTGLWTNSYFAAAGEQAYLTIELANTGNWFITGFEVDFFGPDGNLIETGKFLDLADRIQTTHENYQKVLDEDGNVQTGDNGLPLSEEALSRFDEVGILKPGATRAYRIEFTVPADYVGLKETDFSLQVKNPHCEYSEARKDYIDQDEYIVSDYIAVVDCNTHGVPASETETKTHTWAFDSVPAPYAIEGEDPQPLARGDVNGNGSVNIVDAQLAYDIATNKEGIQDLPDYQSMAKRADVTGDGTVDAADAFSIQYAIHHGWE